MIVDANLLIYAADESSPFHERAAAWLVGALAGQTRVGMPWPVLLAYLRLTTHPRIFDRPLDPATAWADVRGWLQHPAVWVPGPTRRHADVLGRLLDGQPVGGNLVGDAHLAALAIEHGVELCSADSDFARFAGCRWVNPLDG